MSWNSACLFVSSKGPGYFGTFPLHDSDRARELLSAIGLPLPRQTRFSTFAQGLTPPAGWFCVGAYDGGAIVSGLDELYGFTENPDRPVLERCLAAHPTSTILAFELAGRVNYFGYSLYVEGRLQRAVAGDAQRGLVLEKGTIQPEEEPLLRTAHKRDGCTYFRVTVGNETTEATWPEVGESLAFALAGRFLGAPLDRFDADQLSVELMMKPPKGILRRLFGR
jgi:hypothetical protein